MYSEITNNIKVTVLPIFIEEESSTTEELFFWTYHIQIENRNEFPVQLMTRSWDIYDANGVKRQVKGMGVIGTQPVIAPGSVYEYNSAVPLSTPSGIMQGFYVMQAPDESLLEIQIPLFCLDSPHRMALLN